MKKGNKLVKKITAGVLFCFLTAVLTACGTTELDHYDNHHDHSNQNQLIYNCFHQY